MPGPVDASTSASSVVDNYDGDLDELMNAIAAYTNRGDAGVREGESIRVDWLDGGVTLTRGEDNIFHGSNGRDYVAGIDGSGAYRWVRMGVEVNGQYINASNIEKPGFQLTSATITNDITTNIGFIGKTVADKNNWVKMINQAVR